MDRSRKKMTIPFIQKSFFLLLIFLISGNLKAQTSNEFLFEPVVEFNFLSESDWSYSFAVANRSLLGANISGEKVADFTNVHIEVSPFIHYQVGESSEIAVGMRYRFREIYNELAKDRFKFVEEYNYAHPNSLLNVGHRFRMEQKFRTEETIFSFRYRVGIAQALNEEFALGLSTEALYHISEVSKPEAEQRFTLEIANNYFENIEITAGFQYRMDNYFDDLANEYFILAGVGFDI